ncbi:MAG: DUF3857 domain-containing protein [Bacteroidota bacterium]
MKSLYTCCAMVFLFTFAFSSTGNDSLVSVGWNHWNRNNLQQAEQTFLKVLNDDSRNLRAAVALSYLYSVQDRQDKAWEYYSKAVHNAPTPYPYLFAAWITEKFRFPATATESDVLSVLLDLAGDTNAIGTLQASAFSSLGDYYEKKNRLEESKKYYDRMQSVSRWKLIGPFENISASGFDNVFPPETSFVAKKTYAGKNDIPAQWFEFKAIRNDRWIDFTRYFGYSDAVYYANTFIYSKNELPVQVRVGTSGSLKLFLNDDPVMEVREENNNDLDTYIAETILQKGWNRVLIKCGFSEIDNCNFMLRLTDRQGVPLEEVVSSIDEQQYRKNPSPPVTVIENFAEQYFKEQIRLQPQYIENYLLLSDTYLRNDKAAEAEEVVMQMMKLIPDASIGYVQLVEVFARGEKDSEVGDIYEQIWRCDPTLPNGITYQYYQSAGNEDFDEAERHLRSLERVRPGSRDYYSLLIDFYSKKKQVDKLIVAANEAYQKFPEVWNFAQLRANIVLQTERNYAPVLDVIDQFLRLNYTAEAVYTKANVYLRSNDVPKFESTFNTLFTLMPPAPGYYLQLADVYVQLQQYEKAEGAARNAMAIAPGNPNCIEKVANILRMMDRKEDAATMYRKALIYQPTRYDSRESLRELESQPFIFTNFNAADTRRIAETAPRQERYPDDAAVILLDDTKRVVYPEGASEYSREVMIKMFNGRGVDFFKEYSIGFNGYTEKLIVEKAVVIKHDGMETKADVNENTIVFKSLEENDIIHVKWRVKNYYSGKLSRHFWDDVQFNGYLPYALVRYSILVPHGRQFSYRMQHSPLTPAIDTVADGIRYTWTAADVPSIDYEYDMPETADIGSILHISSIPTWEYIVQWYLDLAREKTRPSYEIRETVKNLLQGKEGISDEEKIRLVYDFITEKIRYSNVSFRQSAYIPQSARNVLVHKLGDCKDVATLCIAMLKECGISAYHVLVNTRDEGYNAEILPSISFNHCIVGVESKRGVQYFDLTADNYPAGSLPRADQYASALLIKPGENSSFTLDQAWFMPRNILRTQQVTVNKDLSFDFIRTVKRTGSQAGSFRTTYRHKGKKERDKDLIETLTRDFASVKLHSFELENLDGPEPTITGSYSFSVPRLATQAGGLTIIKSLWTDKITSMEALSYDRRNYPVHFYPGVDTVKETMTITFDPKLKPVDLKPSTVISSKFGTYSVSYTVKKGSIVGVRQFVYRKEIIPSEEYDDFKKFYNDVLKEDERNIVLK